MQTEKLLTISDVATLLQVERHKASVLMKQMPCLVFPGTRTRRVREADLLDWIALNMVHQASGQRHRRKARTEAVPQESELFEPDGRLKRRKV